MTLEHKRYIVIGLSVAFVVSLLIVQYLEVVRRAEEAGLIEVPVHVPESSENCVDCHSDNTPGIVAHWEGSKHAETGVACYDCHAAKEADADSFQHYGKTIATIVTPRDCGSCHTEVFDEFSRSHHAKAGNILASLDNYLAETVEGFRGTFSPHSQTPGFKEVESVDGMASAMLGCKQCHGSKVGFKSTDDSGIITVDDLQPDEDGVPTNIAAVARILKDGDGKPVLDSSTWPNTGIGRLNLDGSTGSCSACHSRHDFSPRRARQPENCGKCHLGPDHPQKEIYEESKHGAAYRDLKDSMNLDSDTWILGEDYAQAPTCATCHMSGNSFNGGRITHDPGERLSWTNRPWKSMRLDTDAEGKIVTEADPIKRAELVVFSAEQKRANMQQVCNHCHTKSYVNAFYEQYDSFLILYNEKFAKPGKMIMGALSDNELISTTKFDEEIEWTWFFLWHHEGRRARHGASMMAPDYTHWHGMYEVADRFYNELIPQAFEIIEEAHEDGNTAAAKAALSVIQPILERDEHAWKTYKWPELSAHEAVHEETTPEGTHEETAPDDIEGLTPVEPEELPGEENP